MYRVMKTIVKEFKGINKVELLIKVVFVSLILVSAFSLIYGLISGQVGASNLGNF